MYKDRLQTCESYLCSVMFRWPYLIDGYQYYSSTIFFYEKFSFTPVNLTDYILPFRHCHLGISRYIKESFCILVGCGQARAAPALPASHGPPPPPPSPPPPLPSPPPPSSPCCSSSSIFSPYSSSSSSPDVSAVPAAELLCRQMILGMTDTTHFPQVELHPFSFDLK